MLNPLINTEALNSATYVDNYIDSVENLPDDVSRQLSRIRDIDVQYRTYLRDVDHYYDLWKSLQNDDESVASRRSRAISRMHQSLIQAQELGDEKLQIVNHLQEIIDIKTRQLDTNQKNLDYDNENHRGDQIPQICNDDISGPIASKLLRSHSPPRGSSTSGGCSTPNSERSSHINNCVLMGVGNSSSGNSNSSGGANINSSNMVSGNKRSRRRNDNINNSISTLEVGGNESNSANEVSNICGNDRSGVLRNSTISSSVHKKNSSHAQSTTSNTTNCTGGAGSGSNSGCGNNSSKKKKRARGARGAYSSATSNIREETPPPDSIDPDEPTYCICNQISFGEMILCDNDLCPIEWFHFSCVSLVLKPKGRWFCPNCRLLKEKPNVMKPKAQFLKELERYNKEKEEKT